VFDAGIPFSESCYNTISDNMDSEDDSQVMLICEWD
jgi:hypothetical protein